MTAITDLRQHALALLELAKKFLVEDGDLDPVAFIIAAGQQFRRPIELQDEESKVESCRKIVDEARQRNALAVITIFIARSKEYAENDFLTENYSWGDLQQDHTERCILLTLSGPKIKNWAVEVFFESKGDKIILKNQVEYLEGVTVGFLPGWSEESTEPSAS